MHAFGGRVESRNPYNGGICDREALKIHFVK
jgi:hypothetical protein